MRLLHPRLVSIVGGLLLATSANAATLGQIELSMSVGDHPEWDWTGTRNGVSDGTANGYTVPNGSYTPDPESYPDAYTISWTNVTFDTDPWVSGVWAITNNSAVTQAYTLAITVPVVAIPGGTLMYGSSTLSLGDANANGTAIMTSLPGFALYAGQIDLVTVLPLFANPYSHTITTPPQAPTYGETDFLGFPPGTIPAGPVLGFIGIEHRFTLTPGDNATFNSVFGLVVVPEPGTGLLLLAGLGILALRRRA